MSKRKIYYLTLFTSVFIVSVATILLYRSGIHQGGNDIGNASSTKTNGTNAWTMNSGTEQADNNETDEALGGDEGEEEDYVTPVLQDAAAPAEGIESLTAMIVPVWGRKLLEYAMDKMVYSKTLDEFSTHSGLDIECETAQAVTASADGIVAEIYNDDRLGMTVVIDHANNFRTVYCNLSDSIAVLPNQIVEKGDVIGYVGNTARIEAIEQPHLHFEVHYMGKPVDPERFIELAAEEILE